MIIENVIDKKNKFNKLNKSDKPIIWLCNNAYIRSNNKYKNI